MSFSLCLRFEDAHFAYASKWTQEHSSASRFPGGRETGLWISRHKGHVADMHFSSTSLRFSNSAFLYSGLASHSTRRSGLPGAVRGFAAVPVPA
jgi:hypothetical protein